MGESLEADFVYKDFVILIGDQKFKSNLIILDTQYFDMILGMCWLSYHRAIVYCLTKEVTFRRPNIPVVTFKDGRKSVIECLVLAYLLNKLMSKG